MESAVLLDYLPHITFFAAVEILIIITFIPWVLMTKREPTAATAWCLLVIFLPILGAFLFAVFGYTRIHRPLKRRRRRQKYFRSAHPPRSRDATHGSRSLAEIDTTWSQLGEIALRVDAFPVSPGNRVTPYHDTREAFDALLQAIAGARHHVHLEFFIVRSDETGQTLFNLLAEKARQGVEIRFLYDAVGTIRLRRRMIRPLQQAGGQLHPFLPINLLRLRIPVNLRNHRKMVVVDGATAFTGGMNVGDEYLGKSSYFGYWRDEFLRLDGPAVAAFQRIFVEDWHFATQQAVHGEAYFPDLTGVGEHTVQVIESGPDQDINASREVYFAALLGAQKSIRIASPYFVPDTGLLDAIRLARYRGVDVQLLTLHKPDHFLSFHASRYFWGELLGAGVKVYQYSRGMMHSKMILLDGQCGIVGSANMDYRSLRLNFEVSCILHTPAVVAGYEAAFDRDVAESQAVDPEAFARRPFLARLAEQACRLFGPAL